jgi:hypothetical protein
METKDYKDEAVDNDQLEASSRTTSKENTDLFYDEEEEKKN